MCWYLLQQLLSHARRPSRWGWFIRGPALISHRQADWTDLNFQSTSRAELRRRRRRNYFDGPAKYMEARDGRRTPTAAVRAGKIDARPVAILNPGRRPPSFLSARIEPAKWYLFCGASAGPAPPFNLISEAPFSSIIDTGVTATRARPIEAPTNWGKFGFCLSIGAGRSHVVGLATNSSFNCDGSDRTMELSDARTVSIPRRGSNLWRIRERIDQGSNCHHQSAHSTAHRISLRSCDTDTAARAGDFIYKALHPVQTAKDWSDQRIHTKDGLANLEIFIHHQKW